MQTRDLNILVVMSSARQSDSVTRRFADEMLDQLRQQYENVNVQQRDVSAGVPFVNEKWINACYNSHVQSADENNTALSVSNSLVDELMLADIVIIGVPIYNFSIPASLKAWIDQIARVGLTFNYTEAGPVGKLHNKKAYLIFASGPGGTQIGSDIDFASAYLQYVLGFIGISDVSIISAAQFDANNKQEIASIRSRISELVQYST